MRQSKAHLSFTWRPLEADPGGQPGTDIEVTPNMPSWMSKGRLHLGMPPCMSEYRFVRVRISILTSKMIYDHLETAGGWSWRPARYRYRGHPLIYLQVYLKVGL